MSTFNYEQVREEYLDVMNEHIEFTTDSTKCIPNLILDILGLAAVNKTSIHAACDVTEDTPTGAAVLYQLHEGWLDDWSLAEVEAQLNALLASRLPPRIRGREHCVAMNLVFIPYHGDPQEAPDEIRRSAAKSGATHVHVYASAYIIYKHKRVTVAVAYYQAQETLLTLLQRLLGRLTALDIGLKQWLLDCQFCSVKIFSYLEQQSWQSVIPVPAHSHELKTLRHTAHRSHQRRYTLSSARDGDLTFDLHVVCRYAMGRRGKHGKDLLLYFAVLGQPRTLANLYGGALGLNRVVVS